MLPVMQEEIVKKRGWASNEEILDYFAIGQCTPGIIAVNTATFIGYKRDGVLGAIFATFGLVTPSVIIIGIIANFFKNFQKYKIVQHAFSGVQIVVVALILNVAISMGKQTIKDNTGLILAIIAFLGIGIFKLSPIIVIIFSGIIGILKYSNIIKIGRKNKNDIT